MNNHGDLHFGDNIGLASISYAPYPSEEKLSVLQGTIARDSVIKSSISWRLSDNYIEDDTAWGYKLESISVRLSKQHGYDQQAGKVALACYVDRLRQTQELVDQVSSCAIEVSSNAN